LTIPPGGILECRRTREVRGGGTDVGAGRLAFKAAIRPKLRPASAGEKKTPGGLASARRLNRGTAGL
jgi:hypothetical protein